MGNLYRNRIVVIDNKKCCSKCKKILILNKKYDTLYCDKCNYWSTSRCGDPTCKTCINRPHRPKVKENIYPPLRKRILIDKCKGMDYHDLSYKYNLEIFRLKKIVNNEIGNRAIIMYPINNDLKKQNID